MHRFDLAVPVYDERLPVEAFKENYLFRFRRP
jgi:hypothetical protein